MYRNLENRETQMSREEFLQKLSQALAGEVSRGVIDENIRYYDDYIRSEAAKGMTEEEVIAQIGEPRLIARTIIDSTTSMEESQSSSGYNSGNNSDNVYEEDGKRSGPVHFVDLNKWYWKLLSIVIVVLVVMAVFGIISTVFAIVIPLLGPVFLICMVVWLLRGFRR